MPGGARETSVDGHELRMAVNYLAPVVLTQQLLPTLTASAPARIVQVGSVGQRAFDVADIEFSSGYDGVDAYRRAKLALGAYTFDLAAEPAGSGVTVNCVHPASLMDTAMVREAGRAPLSALEEGVDAVLRLITDPALADFTGEFLDGPTPSSADRRAYDTAWRHDLRVATDAILG